MIYSGCSDCLLGWLPRQQHTDRRSCCILPRAGQWVWNSVCSLPMHSKQQPHSQHTWQAQQNTRQPEAAAEPAVQPATSHKARGDSRAGQSMAQAVTHSEDPPPCPDSTCAELEDTRHAGHCHGRQPPKALPFTPCYTSTLPEKSGFKLWKNIKA